MKFQPGQSGNPLGRTKGLPNKATREMKEFLKWLDSPEYRENAKKRILRGQAPHLETLWHYYHKGKPKDTMKVEGNLPVFKVVKDDSGQP